MAKVKTQEPRYVFDREFQKEVLHLAIRNGSFLREVRSALSWEYLTDPVHRTVMEEVLQHFDAHGRAPSRGALLERLRDRARKDKTISLASLRSEVMEVCNLDSVDAEWIGPRVREFAATVGARSIISEFDAYAERGEYEEWRKALDAVLRLRHPEPALVKYGTGMEERLASYKHGFVKSKPVPTFSLKFNKLLLGGLDAGEMGVVLGLRGYGKSHILVALGAAAVQVGKKVYHVSLEMGRRSVLRRYDTSLTGLPPKELAGQAGEQAKKLGAANLWVGSYPANTLSPSALRSMVSRRGRPDLLIVDYGRIMRPDFRTDTPYTQIGDIYASLRDIGIEFDCAVWTAGQVNRLGYGKQDSEGDVITLEQVAESIQIGDHADVVVSWNATRQEIHDHKGRLWVDKNREAEDKVMLHMEADWSLSRLKDE